MKDFQGKVAFITGGGSGAGFGQAKVFSEAGCKVVIADVRRDHLEEASAYFRQQGADFLAIELDITDRKAYRDAADLVERTYGTPPQLLFNTAGVNAFGPAEASTFEDFDWVTGVCYGGVVNGMVTFLSRMIKAGLGGHICTTASMGGLMGTPACAPYSAAKAAVINLMESYYLALKPYGIGVSCLCPAGIKTNIGESSYTRPEHLANTGYNTNEKTIEFMRHHYSFGIDPVELAQIFKKGIEDDVLYVLPFPEPEQRMRDITGRMADYTTAEGTRKQDEATAKRRAQMRENPAPMMQGAREAGWARAREDLTWVKQS